MFNFSNWLVSGIIDGFNKQEIPFSKVTELTANYFTKGLISKEQAESIASKCPMPTEEQEEENG